MDRQTKRLVRDTVIAIALVVAALSADHLVKAATHNSAHNNIAHPPASSQ